MPVPILIYYHKDCYSRSLALPAPASLVVSLASVPSGVFAYLMDPLRRDELLLASFATPWRRGCSHSFTILVLNPLGL